MRRIMDYLSIGEPLEVAASDSGGLRFSGYAAVFGQMSEDMGGYRATIAPGAFSKTLTDKRDVRMFLNHDDNIVLASTRAGTLRLSEDAKGLLAQADLPDNEWGRPVADAVRRGDIHTMSIGFKTVRNSWDDSHTTETKDQIRLFEVSPITSWAAFPQTSASVFSLAALAEHIEAETDALDAVIEKLSLGASLSASEADLLVRAAVELYAEWDAAYINDLPDAAFAYIESGGEKDDQGKTVPRSLRHLPHHNAAGEVDMPHLRNAMSRLPQTDMTADAMADARRHMESHMGAMQSSVGAVHEHYLKLRELQDAYESVSL